jgi:hypothetical protein
VSPRALNLSVCPTARSFITLGVSRRARWFEWSAWFSPPRLLVPSMFYAGKDFLPATGNLEFSKSRRQDTRERLGFQRSFQSFSMRGVAFSPHA